LKEECQQLSFVGSFSDPLAGSAAKANHFPPRRKNKFQAAGSRTVNVVRSTTMDVLRRRFISALALTSLVPTPAASAAPGAQPPGGADFPNPVLVDQEGRPVRFYDDVLRGDHTAVVNFIYAQCRDICPAVTANLVQVQDRLGERLGREIRMASISIDPARDTPAILKAYAASFGVRAGWRFLTGKPREIDQIRRRLGAFERDPQRDRDLSQHTGMLVYGQEARGRWGRVSALASPDRIVEAITRWS
jgi:protein SCO1/2